MFCVLCSVFRILCSVLCSLLTVQEERLERNRKWREKKEGREILDDEEKELDENEKRKLKNKEWRQRREMAEVEAVEEDAMEEAVSRPMLVAGVLASLCCAGCHKEMVGRIWQCTEGHNLCSHCRGKDQDQDRDLTICPLCSEPFLGLNLALMAVADIIGGGKFKYEESELSSSSSLDFTLKAPEDEEDSLDFAEPAMDSLVEMKDV